MNKIEEIQELIDNSLAMKCNEDCEPMEDCDDYCEEENPEPLDGLVICYIYIANIHDSKITEFIDAYKESWASIIERIPPNYGVLWVPRREGETTIEQLVFNKGAHKF